MRPPADEARDADPTASDSGMRRQQPPPVPPRPGSGRAPGDEVAGRYRLVRMVARGGMGTVWAAQDTELDRPVAVKFMDDRLVASEELRGRFFREARAAAKLRTPHVVAVYDHGLDGSTPYIVMELLEGEDLHTRVKRRGRLSLSEATHILVQCAKALRAAHDAGIVHRDLKPQNIFLARVYEEETVKILDFGIAKIVDGAGEATQTGAVLGSPHYMSPEQARGLKTTDHRTDLWSLGAILFRTITGKLAFAGDVTGDVIVKICTDPLPRVADVAPDLPPSLDRFFDVALARDPQERFASAMDLARAFAQTVQESGAALDAPLPPVSHPGLLSGAGSSGGWTPPPAITGGSSPGWTPASGASSPLGQGPQDPVAPSGTPAPGPLETTAPSATHPSRIGSTGVDASVSRARLRTSIAIVGVLGVLAAATLVILATRPRPPSDAVEQSAPARAPSPSIATKRPDPEPRAPEPSAPAPAASEPVASVVAVSSAPGPSSTAPRLAPGAGAGIASKPPGPGTPAPAAKGKARERSWGY